MSARIEAECSRTRCSRGREPTRRPTTPAASAAEHDDLARDLSVPGAVHENNAGMMSLGSEVAPQHYATFGYALQALTGVDEWKLA